jgi:cobalt-zinc-cadmium efflux system protein
VGEDDVFLEGHIRIDDMPVSESERIHARISQMLHDRFEIHHITLQFECELCTHTDDILSLGKSTTE